MPAMFRVDCKLANYKGPFVRSEPRYLNDEAALLKFLERQANKHHNDPYLLVWVVNKWNGIAYVEIALG